MVDIYLSTGQVGNFTQNFYYYCQTGDFSTPVTLISKTTNGTSPRAQYANGYVTGADYISEFYLYQPLPSIDTSIFNTAAIAASAISSQSYYTPPEIAAYSGAQRRRAPARAPHCGRPLWCRLTSTMPSLPPLPRVRPVGIIPNTPNPNWGTPLPPVSNVTAARHLLGCANSRRTAGGLVAIPQFLWRYVRRRGRYGRKVFRPGDGQKMEPG